MSAKVLITGASGGFGRLTVEQLTKKGHKVAASMRDLNGKNKDNAATIKAMGAETIEMDVTRDDSVDKGVQTAIQKLGGLDVVINNAGVGVLGLQETFTSDDWKKIFEVNVFGLNRVTRAALPHFRTQKSGLFINVSSLLGRITVPFYGPYNASKWAVEALTENYRTELSQCGVEFCIVEPGGYPTSFIDNLVRPSDKGRAQGYGEMANMAEGFLENFEKALASNPAQNPKDVAIAMVNLVEGKRGQRAFRTVVDKMGMGDHITPYNDQLGKITASIYGAFGIGHLLNLK